MYRILILAASLVGASASAVAQQPAKTTPASPRARAEAQPLLFYVARGEANACGLGCSEWIAVEGFFNSNSAARFREFLTRLGRRTLPVFFHAPGGMQSQALATGRVLREFGMTAGVARTMPEACQPEASAGSCEAAKKSGQTLRAEWNSIGAVCNSGCVYALIGARNRWIPTGARLGIHATYTDCSVLAGVPADMRDERCAKGKATNRAQLDSYVKEMGVDPKLVESAYRTPHTGVRFLSRAEISSFGIERGGFEDSTWLASGAKPLTIVNFVSQPIEGMGVMRRTGIIEYGCNHGVLHVAYHRPTEQTDTGAGTAVTAVIDGRRYPFPQKGSIAKQDVLGPESYFDRRILQLSARHVNPGTIAIEVAGHPQNAPIVLHPSFNGFQRAWETLQKNCGI
jgi:hypothetical protein